MLENAIRACPADLWGDAEREPQFWHLAFHTLFYLDFYLSDCGQGFAPPAPFTLTELEPSGILPERVYSKTEVLEYLEYGRRKARRRIDGLTEESVNHRCEFDWINLSVWESLLYNMRHIQHHAAQLNLLLRQANHPVPRWVARSLDP